MAARRARSHWISGANRCTCEGPMADELVSDSVSRFIGFKYHNLVTVNAYVCVSTHVGVFVYLCVCVRCVNVCVLMCVCAMGDIEINILNFFCEFLAAFLSIQLV